MLHFLAFRVARHAKEPCAQNHRRHGSVHRHARRLGGRTFLGSLAGALLVAAKSVCPCGMGIPCRHIGPSVVLSITFQLSVLNAFSLFFCMVPKRWCSTEANCRIRHPVQAPAPPCSQRWLAVHFSTARCGARQPETAMPQQPAGQRRKKTRAIDSETALARAEKNTVASAARPRTGQNMRRLPVL